MPPADAVDVHQHLWPEAFISELRRRQSPPMLRGWTLFTAGEAPFEVNPADHDPAVRRLEDPEFGRRLLSLSSPLGIEDLPPDAAEPLLEAWHQGLAELSQPGSPFRGWAAVNHRAPDLDRLSRGFAVDGLVGLQLAATQLATPAAIERVGPVLRRCEQANVPVLVHPGPVPATPATPPWWPAIVQYPAQLQAAWWAWHVAGPSLFPELRICFVAGGGLAALQHERFEARSGQRTTLDRNAYVETSSYGRQAVDALTRVLGIDAVVVGSDRPYAAPTDPQLGAAAWRAITVTNPNRLLQGTKTCE
ncbi:MAG: amidohydrolase [Frankiales bacterium]|nr:amidohydrolase [Frankiales bacterium]